MLNHHGSTGHLLECPAATKSNSCSSSSHSGRVGPPTPTLEVNVVTQALLSHQYMCLWVPHQLVRTSEGAKIKAPRTHCQQHQWLHLGHNIHRHSSMASSRPQHTPALFTQVPALPFPSIVRNATNNAHHGDPQETFKQPVMGHCCAAISSEPRSLESGQRSSPT
jgi:hypothetical protein